MDKYGVREVRSYGSASEVRASTEEGSRKIVGYAVVFGVASQNLREWGTSFEEVIHPEAITEELLNRSDVKALMEHNRQRLLARSNKRVGTLSLSIDAKGLRYEFDAPNTSDGNDALELVRRGDIAGSSFAFSIKDETGYERTWDEERKMWRYEVKRIDALYDVTLTSDPAYTETSVEVRSLQPPTEDPAPTSNAYSREEMEAYRLRAMK